MESENLVDNARTTGDYLIAKLKELQQREKHITEVRGRGLMIGIELDTPHKPIREALLHEQHVFTGCAGTSTLRLLPPLCFTQEMADEFITRLENVL